MKYFKPTIYQKTIFDIPYKKLKKENIKLLLFDLDNTIIPFYDEIVPLKTKEKFTDLKKDFTVVIFSNSRKKRVKKIASQLDVFYLSFAKKPLPFSFKKILKEYDVRKDEIVIIGDQLFTDILGGNKFNIKTVLVEPLAIKELFITKFNRFLEKICFKKLSKKYGFEKGKYYE